MAVTASGMRMRDLERASGVSRETIRFYIREGLLPEPERTHRNSATYSAEHLDRLIAIRRLKDERLLPLAAIRVLLAGEDASSLLKAERLPEIEHLLRSRLDAGLEGVDGLALCLSEGGDPEQLADAVAKGVITMEPDGCIGPRDARILKLLIDLDRLGFNRARGYDSAGTVRLMQTMRELAAEDIAEFFDRMTPHVSDAEAVELAERGIGIHNQLMAELFTRELLALLAERTTTPANDADGPQPVDRDGCNC